MVKSEWKKYLMSTLLRKRIYRRAEKSQMIGSVLDKKKIRNVTLTEKKVDNVSTWLEMCPRDLCNGWLSKVGCQNPQSQGAR